MKPDITADGRAVIVSAFRFTGTTAGSARPASQRCPSAATSTTPQSRRSPWLSAGGSCWRHATIAEIAAAEKINESYVRRVLRLTLIASDIVDAILSGRQPAEVTLAVPAAAVRRGVDGRH